MDIITIDQNDLPITVASKIIGATKPGKNLIGEEIVCDAFTTKEIKEIANYLLTYYYNHSDED